MTMNTFKINSLVMKNTLAVIISLLFLSQAIGQTKKAEARLDEVSEMTQSYRSMKIDFSYKMDNKAADIHEVEKGTLKIKGDKYRLYIAGQIVINDGETMWTYIEDANEVQINTVEEEGDDFVNPSKLLNSYGENYKARYIDQSKWMGRTVEIIELRPHEDKSFKKVELIIDAAKKRIMKITIYDKNDNEFSYIVDEFKANVLFDPADFTFQEEDYPGVEVIDMR